ncbi:MAG TPA: aminotransferase class III-fold pyridoxal phosphate-dependent enzyme [Acidimicrobiales bacterium]|nr:aminotransferase class III-fold pyridoxal phosphate-dependent enzyme [Acidimicrobiales bacterium]
MEPPAFLHPFAPPAATDFTTIVRGEGAAVFDREGRRYVDALASLWYCNVGHGRAEVADAVARQARTLAGYHAFDRFTNEPADALCEALAGLAPMAGARVFLTSSGSEAVDSAIKLARLAQGRAGHPERTVVVGRQHSYHGVTFGGLSVQGLPLNQEGFGPLLPEVRQVLWDDLDDLARVLEREEGRVAAVLAEPVIGAGGVRPSPPGYLEGMRRLCDESGALLVLDEVICGFGRLGAWWGAERDGVEPDLVTFAKGVTSGYQPLGGVLVGRAVRAALESGPAFLLRHGHTYSGHPTACAAALANIEVLRDEGLLDRAGPIGDRLGGGLEELVRQGVITEVRGTQAIWAAVLPAEVTAQEVHRAMLDRGVIARPLGTDVIAFCPPLVIDEVDLDRCVGALAESVAEVAG